MLLGQLKLWKEIIVYELWEEMIARVRRPSSLGREDVTTRSFFYMGLPNYNIAECRVPMALQTLPPKHSTYGPTKSLFWTKRTP